MVVAPLIEPLIERLPFDVVTVQSPVCAEGLLNTELMTTWSFLIFVFEMVCGNDENDVELITTHSALTDSNNSVSDVLFSSVIADTLVLGYKASVFAESSNNVVTFAIGHLYNGITALKNR